MEHAPDLAAAADADLRKQVEELTAKLAQYEKLEEDLMAQRVFVKARRQLTTWITVGGLVAFAVGFVGFRDVEHYLHRTVNAKVDKLTTRDVRNAVLERTRVVATRVATKEADNAARDLAVKQRVGELLARVPGFKVIPPSALRTPKVGHLDYSSEFGNPPAAARNGGSVAVAAAVAVEYRLASSGDGVGISTGELYYFARKDAGLDVHEDTGTTISGAIVALARDGAVARSVWPYGDFAAAPPAALAHAKRYRLTSAVPVEGTEQVKAALARYGPVVIGMEVFPSFEHGQATRTGVVPDPKPTESTIGATGVLIVGYDDATRRFKFRNNWGKDWGDGGYGYVSYRYVDRYASDGWALADVTGS